MGPLFLLWCMLFGFFALPTWGKSIEMDKSTFDSLTASGIWLVEHFSPYCHFCVDFAPVWQELAEEQDDLARTHDIHFGTIDCSLHGDLCTEHDITGFPKIQLYVDGKYEQTYIDARSKETIKAYLLQEYRRVTKQRRQRKNSVLRLDATTMQELLDRQQIMVIGAYQTQEERRQFKRLSEQANGAALFVELDLDSLMAQTPFGIQQTKILIVDGKKNQYYDSDKHSKWLDLQQPQHILRTLEDAIAGKLDGKSMDSLGQHEHLGLGLLDRLPYVVLAMVALLVAAVYKVIPRKKSIPATNVARTFISSSTKLV